MTPKAYSYIRFSTPEQERGDSLRRQVELSKAYAESNGLELDTTLSLRDLGLSAFNGAHRGRGKLGEFLQLVDQGKITVGSVLLVESFDRLSREEITEALEQFLSLIRKGIRIVTLVDNREYSKETINANMGELIVSITIMSRAHEESATKSKRVRAAWSAKRSKLNERKLTGRCPEWLCLPQGKREFLVIPDRGEIIQKIFELKMEGFGSQRVVKYLNQNDKYWNPGGWRKNYVEKIWRNPAVVGIYQPHETIRGVRKPIGEPVPNYYPPVVPEQLYYQVQHLLDKNVKKAGRLGGAHSLFTHLTYCGYCKAPMYYYGTGKHIYLICSRAYNKGGCEYLSVPYLEVEYAILKYCKGLDPTNVIQPNEAQNQVRILQDRLTAIQAKLDTITKQKELLADSIVTAEKKATRDFLTARLDKLVEEQESLENQSLKTGQELETAHVATSGVKENLEAISQLYDAMDSVDAEERVNLRLRLRRELQRLINRIVIHPFGFPRRDRNHLTIWLDFVSGTVRKITPRLPSPGEQFEYDVEIDGFKRLE